MRQTLNIIRRWRRCEDGATAVEFGLIGMIMIVTTFGLIEIGRGLYLYNKLSYAADLAARMVLTNPSIANDHLKNEIVTAFSDDKLPLYVMTTSGSSSTGSSVVKFKIVEISMMFKPLIPKILSDEIRMRVTRRVPMLP